MTTIYGLRLIGTTEVRYVGQTGKSLAYRLMQHKSKARRWCAMGLTGWIKSFGAGVEIIPLAECAEGNRWAVERAVVEALTATGNRLYNSHLNPAARVPTADRNAA